MRRKVNGRNAIPVEASVELTTVVTDVLCDSDSSEDVEDRGRTFFRRCWWWEGATQLQSISRGPAPDRGRRDAKK